jgi:ABC-type lipoprotein release transport system permease subunit
MAAVWALVRARLRERRRALVGLALLVGVASGAVMAAAIGARRTDTAYDRLLAVTLADDAEVQVGGYEDYQTLVDRLRRLPQAADLGVESQALLAPAMPGDPRKYVWGSGFISLASVDGRVGRTINRPLILAGRRPDPTRADEIGVSELVARRWRLRPGGTFRVRTVAFDQFQAVFTGEQIVPAGPALTLKVVAVQRLPEDPAVGAGGPAVGEGFVSLTPAFHRAYKEKVANFPAVRVRLRRGQADMPAFAAATRRLAGNSPEVGVVPRTDVTRLVEDGIRAQAVALVLFAALAGAAALVVVGQTLARELSLASAGQETVRALGASRGHLLAATLVPIGLVGAAGAVLGAVVAVLASPLAPMGLALEAEPDPGLAVNLAGLGIGMAATLALVLGRVAVPAWRLAGERPHRPGITATGTSSALADAAARAGLPPTSVTGLRMALEQGRGPRAVPVRASLVGVTAGIVALTAAITFGASLDRLLATPRLYGWNFDAAAAAPDWQRLDDPASSRPSWLADNPQVGAWSAVWFSNIKVNGTVVNAASFDTAGGRVFPTLVEGREPSGPDELVLGSRTLRRLGLHLGQTVQVEAGRPAAMRIVGRSALVHTDDADAGEGAILTIDGLRRLGSADGDGYGMFYLRFAPDADPGAALRSLQRPPSGPPQVVDLPRPPVDVANLGRVGALPNVLAGLLALLAASALAHLLVTSVRRRRHDLAILKALGFVRRQVSAAVAWQATTVALVALAVGLPLGVALGRWSWSLLADRIGVGAPPVTPGPALLAGVAGTILVANLVAAWPGRVAARTRPAVALRSE